MFAQPAMMLGSVPMYSPFPVTLVLSTAATVVFGAELVIAALWVHPRRWLYALLGSCVALGTALMAWSGYYALYGPNEVEPRIEGMRHIGIRTPITPDPWYHFYSFVFLGNVAIALVTLVLVLVFGIVLWRQKRKAQSLHV